MVAEDKSMRHRLVIFSFADSESHIINVMSAFSYELREAK